MNNELDLKQIIDRSALSEDNYFQSLLEQAKGKGLLGENDIKRIQTECLSLLADKAERYNGGNSSSIRVEKAQEIINSVFFTVGLWLKGCPSPDKAVQTLREESIRDIYKHGLKRNRTLLSVTKVLHHKMLSGLMESPNVFYRATLADGISGFFKLYDPEYAAQEVHITANYPLYNPIPDLKGIELISAYVKGAYCENLFCGCFASYCIHHLLSGYEKNYKELLFNIYEQVLTTALCCIIAGTELRQLDITQQGVCFLEGVFSDKTEQELNRTLKEAAVSLKEQLGLAVEVCRYLEQSVPLVAGKISGAVRAKRLQSVIFLPAHPENKPKLLFSYGDKMDNEAYRRIVNEIHDCRYLSDKLAIIKENIRSLADLADLLEDAELSDEETPAVFALLSLPEIAVLSKNTVSARMQKQSVLTKMKMLSRGRLKNFILKMSAEQQSIIKKTAAAIAEN